MKAVTPPFAALHTASSQQDLWQRFRQGNRDAFSAIYHAHIDHLYHYGLHFCGDGERVRDCLQELFQDLWLSREHLAETLQNVRYYLLSSLRRRLLRGLEKDRRMQQQVAIAPFDFELIPPRESLIINDEQRREQLLQLHSALATLPPRQREAIYLRFFQNLSYQEVADVMAMRVDSVYNIISKAIGMLRKMLTLQVLLLLLHHR